MTLKSVLGYVSDYVKNLLKKILDYEEGEIDDDDDDLSIEWPNFAADQSISSRRIKKEIHQFLNLLHRSSMGWGKWHFSMPLFSLITTTLCMYTPIDRSHKGLYCLTFAFFYLFFPLLDCILLLLSRIVSFYEVNQIPRNSSLVGHIFQKVFKFISQIYFVGNMKIIDTTQLFISYRAWSHQVLIQDIKFPTCWKACDLSQSTVDSFLVSFFFKCLVWFYTVLVQLDQKTGNSEATHNQLYFEQQYGPVTCGLHALNNAGKSAKYDAEKLQNMARDMESRTIETDNLHYSEYNGYSDQLLLEALKTDFDTDLPSDVNLHNLNKYFAYICWIRNRLAKQSRNNTVILQ